jgi:ribonuclease HI
MNSRLYIYCDGACKGNPGPAAIGGVIRNVPGKEAEPLVEISALIGIGTNNEAEYRSLIESLEQASAFKPEYIEIRMDSELVVKQVKGIYKVKNERLKPLMDQVKSLLGRFSKWNILHVPREENSHADRLANLAYKTQNLL